MIEEGKSQQDIITYLRGLGFVFILTEDFLFHFPGFEFNKKDVGEATDIIHCLITFTRKVFVVIDLQNSVSVVMNHILETIRLLLMPNSNA